MGRTRRQFPRMRDEIPTAGKPGPAGRADDFLDFLGRYFILQEPYDHPTVRTKSLIHSPN